MRFGRLVVTDQAPKGKSAQFLWNTVCDCGTRRVNYASNLRRGVTKSCGCLIAEGARQRNTKHGMFGTSEYGSWSSMMSRCRNERDPAFAGYGARGIYVCEEWKDFARFFADMGPKPGKGYSIERIDNNRGYSPDNCKWATSFEQGNNKRTNRVVEYRGQTMTLSQALTLSGAPKSRTTSRLLDGWSAQEAIDLPVGSRPTIRTQPPRKKRR